MFDVIVQGPCYPFTKDVIESYINHHTDKVIYSGWKGESKPLINSPRVTCLQNEKPLFQGRGNLNCQLITSYEGLKLTTTKFVLKTRSDLIIDKFVLQNLIDYYKTNIQISDALPYGKILVMYMSNVFPFHACDFIYFGLKKDIEVLLSVPLITIPNIVPECYIAGSYVAYYEPYVNQLIEEKNSCFTEFGSKFKYCTFISSQFMFKYFHSLPSIKIIWMKRHTKFIESYSLAIPEHRLEKK